MPTTNREPLIELIFDRLAATGVPTEVAEIVLASLVSEQALESALAGQPTSLDLAPSGRDPVHPHLCLSSVTVAGFRGVGEERTLPLTPKAGLTVVVGRNGSGKSSFAEAVELSLTGDSSRWADKNSVWRTGWRNLHVPDPCAITTELRADGAVTPTRITRAWASGASLTEAEVTVSTPTGTSTNLDDLGLTQDLDLYRPFLTATDLGKLLAGSNTELFDAIDAILGLDLLTTADKRLMTAARPRDASIKQVREDRQALRASLEGHADPRAQRAATLLATTRPALDQLDALLAEPHPADPDGNVAVARALAELTVPDPAQVDQIAGDLDAAAQDNQRHDQVDAGTYSRRRRPMPLRPGSCLPPRHLAQPPRQRLPARRHRRTPGPCAAAGRHVARAVRRPGRGGDVRARLGNQYGTWAVDAYQACRHGVHGGAVSDLPQLVRYVRRLTRSLT